MHAAKPRAHHTRPERAERPPPMMDRRGRRGGKSDRGNRAWERFARRRQPPHLVLGRTSREGRTARCHGKLPHIVRQGRSSGSGLFGPAPSREQPSLAVAVSHTGLPVSLTEGPRHHPLRRRVRGGFSPHFPFQPRPQAMPDERSTTDAHSVTSDAWLSTRSRSIHRIQ